MEMKVDDYLTKQLTNVIDSYRQNLLNYEEFRDLTSSILAQALNFVAKVTAAMVAWGAMREKVIADITQALVTTFYAYLEDARKEAKEFLQQKENKEKQDKPRDK